MLFSCKMSLCSNEFSSVCHKLGCFKRKKLYEEQEEEAAIQVGTPTELTPAPTKGIVSQSETDSKSEQSSEDKLLLDDGEANGTSLPTDTEEGLD